MAAAFEYNHIIDLAAIDPNSAKRVAQLIAWLHESLVNELHILDHTLMDSGKHLEVMNTIFSYELSKQVKNKLE